MTKAKILFKAGIWTVTNYGIECVKERYFIEASRICEKRGELPDWPLHLVEKNWADIENFILVFEWALNNHPKVKNVFTADQLAECFKETRWEALYNREFEKFCDKRPNKTAWINADSLDKLFDEFDRTWDGKESENVRC